MIRCNAYFLCKFICVCASVCMCIWWICALVLVYAWGYTGFCLWVCLHASVFVFYMNLCFFQCVCRCLSAQYICTACAWVCTLCVKLTERSFHVIGRTCRGIPDQLSFRSSSVKQQQKYQRVHFRFTQFNISLHKDFDCSWFARPKKKEDNGRW